MIFNSVPMFWISCFILCVEFSCVLGGQQSEKNSVAIETEFVTQEPEKPIDYLAPIETNRDQTNSSEPTSEPTSELSSASTTFTPQNSTTAQKSTNALDDKVALSPDSKLGSDHKIDAKVKIIEENVKREADNDLSLAINPIVIIESDHPNVAEREPKSYDLGTALTHEVFDKLLQKYVSKEGWVDYGGFKQSEQTLDAYLQELGKNMPADLDTSEEALAYWINLYNAATIKLILKNLPVKTITQIENGKPWDLKWIQLGTKSFTLNNIEHDIIRKRWKEPRIHFVLVCAAKSCPKLNNGVFTASNIDAQMTRLTKEFLASDKNKISENSAIVSKLFEWYGGDFGNIVSFINRYSAVKLDTKAKISFMEYDWSLNGK